LVIGDTAFIATPKAVFQANSSIHTRIVFYKSESKSLISEPTTFIMTKLKCVSCLFYSYILINDMFNVNATYPVGIFSASPII